MGKRIQSFQKVQTGNIRATARQGRANRGCNSLTLARPSSPERSTATTSTSENLANLSFQVFDSLLIIDR